MTCNEIINMAQEAGTFKEIDGTESMSEASWMEFATLVEAHLNKKYPIQLTHEQYNAVINAALADEREACAKVCEDEEARVEKLQDSVLETSDEPAQFLTGKAIAARSLAAAIRARGQE